MGPVIFPDEEQSGGLLGSIRNFINDPRNAQGLAQFGRALAQAGAPSRVGPTWGGGLSDALAGFNEGRQAYDQNQAAKAMRELQLKKLQSEIAENEAQAAARLAPKPVKRDIREINGQLIEVPESGAPSAIFGQPKLPDYLQYGPDGKPMINPLVLDAKKKIAEAGRSTATTNVALPPAEKAFDVELAKLDAKELDDMRNAATKASGGLARVGEMKRLHESGVYSGTLAEGRTGVANFFSTMGIPLDEKKLANSQEYLKHAKELTLSLLKEGVGTNQISNADLKFVNDTVPQLETNPKARIALLNYIEGRLQNSLNRFKAASDYAAKNKGLRGFTYNEQQSQKTSGGQFVEGGIYTDANGNRAKYVNGKWEAVK